MFNELNKSFESPFTFEPEQGVYKKLVDLEPNKKYVLISLFINTKSKYGEHPVLGADDGNASFWVSVPQHLTDVAKQILSGQEYIDQINSGKVGFTVETFFSKKYNREGHTIKFVDL